MVVVLAHFTPPSPQLVTPPVTVPVVPVVATPPAPSCGSEGRPYAFFRPVFLPPLSPPPPVFTADVFRILPPPTLFERTGTHEQAPPTPVPVPPPGVQSVLTVYLLLPRFPAARTRSRSVISSRGSAFPSHSQQPLPLYFSLPTTSTPSRSSSSSLIGSPRHQALRPSIKCHQCPLLGSSLRRYGFDLPFVALTRQTHLPRRFTDTHGR